MIVHWDLRQVTACHDVTCHGGKQGLAVGDVVVTDGVDKLQQGARVSVQTAALPPGSTTP